MAKHFEDVGESFSQEVLDTDVVVLKRCALFYDLPDLFFQHLKQCATMLHVPHSTVLLQPSEVQTKLFIVIEGQFAIYKNDALTTLFEQATAGSVIGLSGLVTPGTGLVYVNAQWPSRVLSIELDKLQVVMSSYPSLSFNALKLLQAWFKKIGDIGLVSEMDSGATNRNAVTGLYNRRWMLESYELELAESRAKGLSPALLVIEVNHFFELTKRLNRVSGDIVLRQLVDVIMEQMGEDDICAHLSLDRFVVLIRHTTASWIQSLAEKIRQRAASRSITLPGSMVVQLTFSIVALMAKDNDVDSLLAQALELLSQVDNVSGNKVIIEQSVGDDD